MISRAWISLFLMAVLSACCTIGPNDNPGGVVNYFKECYAFMQGE